MYFVLFFHGASTFSLIPLGDKKLQVSRSSVSQVILVSHTFRSMLFDDDN